MRQNVSRYCFDGWRCPPSPRSSCNSHPIRAIQATCRENERRPFLASASYMVMSRWARSTPWTQLKLSPWRRSRRCLLSLRYAWIWTACRVQAPRFAQLSLIVTLQSLIVGSISTGLLGKRVQLNRHYCTKQPFHHARALVPMPILSQQHGRGYG